MDRPRTLITTLHVIESYRRYSPTSSIYSGFDAIRDGPDSGKLIKNPRRLGNVFDQVRQQLPFSPDSSSTSPLSGSIEDSPASSQTSAFSEVSKEIADDKHEASRRRSSEKAKSRPRQLSLAAPEDQPLKSHLQNEGRSQTAGVKPEAGSSPENTPPPPPPKSARHLPAPRGLQPSVKCSSRSESNFQQAWANGVSNSAAQTGHAALETVIPPADRPPQRPGPQRGKTAMVVPKRPPKSRNISAPPQTRRHLERQASLNAPTKDREPVPGGVSHSQLVPFVLAQTPPGVPREPLELPKPFRQEGNTSRGHNRTASDTQITRETSEKSSLTRNDSLRLDSPSLVPAPLFPPSFPRLRSIPLEASRDLSPPHESVKPTHSGKRRPTLRPSEESEDPAIKALTSASLAAPFSQPAMPNAGPSQVNTRSPPQSSRPGMSRGPGSRRPSAASSYQQLSSFSRQPSQTSAYPGSQFSRQPIEASSQSGSAFSRQPSQTSAYPGPQFSRLPSQASAYSGSQFSRQQSHASGYQHSQVSRQTSQASLQPGSHSVRQQSQANAHPFGWQSHGPRSQRSHTSSSASPSTSLQPPPMLRSTSQPLHRSPETYGDHDPAPHTTTSDDPTVAESVASPRQPVAAPALRPAHYDCYIQHRPLLPSRNLRAPVRCMTCGGDAPCMFKCGWCCLRICGACARILTACRGDLGRMAPPTVDAVAGDALRRRVEAEVDAAAREIRAGSAGRMPGHSAETRAGGERGIPYGDPRPKRGGAIAGPLAPAAAPQTPWPSVLPPPPQPPSTHAPPAPRPPRPAGPSRADTAPARPSPRLPASRDPTPPRHIRFREPERPPRAGADPPLTVGAAAAGADRHLAVPRHVQPPVSAEDSCFDIAGSRVAHAKARLKDKMPLF